MTSVLSIPINITNFQVFKDDKHILDFITSSDVFAAQIIDEEEPEEAEIDIEGILNLKTNTIPRMLKSECFNSALAGKSPSIRFDLEFVVQGDENWRGSHQIRSYSLSSWLEINLFKSALKIRIRSAQFALGLLIILLQSSLKTDANASQIHSN